VSPSEGFVTVASSPFVASPVSEGDEQGQGQTQEQGAGGETPVTVDGSSAESSGVISLDTTPARSGETSPSTAPGV